MSRITLDPASLQKLASVVRPVEVVDDAGKVIGEFIPKFDPTKWEVVGEDATIEELDRQLASSERTYTTEEVLEHLRKLK
jgi:hypothetical protein